MYHQLPNTAPRPLPTSANCKLNYSPAYGYAVCTCRRFAIASCLSRELATAIWNERHMLADPGPVGEEAA